MFEFNATPHHCESGKAVDKLWIDIRAIACADADALLVLSSLLSSTHTRMPCHGHPPMHMDAMSHRRFRTGESVKGGGGWTNYLKVLHFFLSLTARHIQSDKFVTHHARTLVRCST